MATGADPDAATAPVPPATLIAGLAGAARLRTRARAALRGAGDAAVDPCWDALAGAGHDLAGELWRVLGDLAAADAGAAARLRPRLLAALPTSDPWTRRRLVAALGRAARGDDAVAAVLGDLLTEADPPLWRSLVAALGRCGGAAARRCLGGLATDPADAAAAQVLAEARRRTARGTAVMARPANTAAPLAGHPVELRCRLGLEPLLLEALPRAWDGRRISPGRVRCRPPSLAALVAVPYHYTAVLPLAEVDGEAGPAALAAALAAPPALSAWRRVAGTGPLRYRVEWEQAGQRRGATAALASAFAALVPTAIDTPTRADWDLLLRRRCGRWHLDVAPRLPEKRWPWRQALVPAASHLPLAEALVALVAPRAGELVFDPCCGAASELVCAGLRHSGVRLGGRDRDPRALAAAGCNAQAAGVIIDLAVGDALDPWPAGVAAVVTNPPLGRRVPVAGLHHLLTGLRDRVVALGSGARLAWIRPPELADDPRLAVGRRLTVDLGGFRGVMELLAPAGGRRSAAAVRSRS
jgi:hypothetical protein